MRPRPPALMRGFTLIELLITLALVGLLSSVALPVYELTSTRMKEAELRQALRTIREGLDAYKAAVDAGLLVKKSGESGYPPNLDTLAEPQDLVTKKEFGLDATLAARRMVILRRLPRDPFFPDNQVPAAQTWNTRAYASRPDDTQSGDDVFDVSSKSTRTAMDGTPYSSW